MFDTPPCPLPIPTCTFFLILSSATDPTILYCAALCMIVSSSILNKIYKFILMNNLNSHFKCPRFLFFIFTFLCQTQNQKERKLKYCTTITAQFAFMFINLHISPPPPLPSPHLLVFVKVCNHGASVYSSMV